MKNVFENICYILISGCGVALARYICLLVNKKVDELQLNKEIKNNEKLNQYIDLAQDAIEDAVLQTMQVYVDTLKKQNKFDETAQEEAKNKAIETAKALISEESKNAIVILHNDFEVFLDARIEALVNIKKSLPNKDNNN